jgi:long-chain acyl-CoA synthetase
MGLGKTSTQEYIAKANAISRALLKMDTKKGDKIALISSNNRTEWNIMDIGVLNWCCNSTYLSYNL